MRISTKNARLIRKFIKDARLLRDLGRRRFDNPNDIGIYWFAMGRYNDWNMTTPREAALWQKVRGRVGD